MTPASQLAGLDFQAITWGDSDSDSDYHSDSEWLANKLPCLWLSVFLFSVFRLCLCLLPLSFTHFVFVLFVVSPLRCCLFVCLPFVCAGGLRKGIPNILQRARHRNWNEMIRGPHRKKKGAVMREGVGSDAGAWAWAGRGALQWKVTTDAGYFMFYACYGPLSPPRVCHLARLLSKWVK